MQFPVQSLFQVAAVEQTGERIPDGLTPQGFPQFKLARARTMFSETIKADAVSPPSGGQQVPWGSWPVGWQPHMEDPEGFSLRGHGTHR